MRPRQSHKEGLYISVTAAGVSDKGIATACLVTYVSRGASLNREASGFAMTL